MSLQTKRITSCSCLNCKVIRINCVVCRLREENEQLKREQLKTTTLPMYSCAHWCYYTGNICKSLKENEQLRSRVEPLEDKIKKLEKENDQLIEALLKDYVDDIQKNG